jgi:hypothetical protein
MCDEFEKLKVEYRTWGLKNQTIFYKMSESDFIT